ncbi:hypothetical protein [uncultured Campylobacter sp.]|uniref:hypothetical protein n=1 Tax=uncultured Campylobacter sp. TaxID=218934 RepID=UPI003211A046
MNTGVASTERIFELGAGGIEILKDSFICLDGLRETLGRLRLLRGRLNGIRTKSAWVHCSVNDGWELKICILAYAMNSNRHCIKLGNMIVFEIEEKAPLSEVDEILEKLFEILRAPKLKDAVLSAYLTQKNGVFIEEDKK